MENMILDKNSLFNRFAALMDQNTRGVQIGIYSVAVVGLAVAIRSVRPFTRFVKPSDIPKTFISSRIKLNGRVTRIEPGGGPLLMIQHRPLVPLIPRSNQSSEGLPVRVAGVNITGNGVSWLQTIVSGNDVTFVPLQKQSQYVVCEVTMKHRSLQATTTLNIGEELVALGFGTVAIMDPHLSSNERYQAYYKRLLAAETRAEKRRMGVWHYNSPSPPWHSRLIAQLWNRTKHNLAPRLSRASYL